VDRLPSGRWRARYLGPDGHRHSSTFRKKGDADAFLNGQQTDQGRGVWVDPRLGRTPLGEWVERWWATTTNLRPSTRARDWGYIDRYILPPFKDQAIGEVTQLDVRAWVAELSATGLAPATVVKAYQILGKLLAAAVDGGLIATTPCRRVPLPRVEREEMRFLTPEQVATLAESIHPRYRALVLVGAYGGPRIGEMAGLRRSRVDPLRSRIDIAEICVEVRGHLTFGPPKTRAGRRMVTLPRFVAEALAHHLATFVAPGPDAFVFPAPAGGALRVPSWRRRFWAPAVVAAGLEPLRAHDLRHTAVALWIAQGANPKQVAARAGHSSVSFALDRYGHLFPEADEALLVGLEAAHNAASAESLRSRSGHAEVTVLSKAAKKGL